MKKILYIIKKVVELLYGISAARVSKERAEAASKWIECYTKYFDFVQKTNLPTSQKRRIMLLLEAKMRKHIIGS